MLMWQFCVIFVASLVSVQSQIPSFGRCPEFEPMPGFSREKFLGTWYEFERYFTATEVLSKCISATYEKRADGKMYINNHYVNRM
jgi:apolipoprotein D and lipocalin family protein